MSGVPNFQFGKASLVSGYQKYCQTESLALRNLFSRILNPPFFIIPSEKQN
ncbi:Uncharacterized protein dnm_002620 [Desulfonema magnum]|uniref:Uncharacterized protein n=1 Tax=Desulfonema magnum TaxID=45655 RepID=A0A975GKZ8_9BACT|nr:Uncharacterized protein dnm_002620 [Desulfonema magnum]